MKDQIDIAREGIKAALGADVFVDKPIRRALLDALTALSDLESHLAQYEAGDMASAAAQGFRDGVASVTQQEPVAWVDGSDLELMRKHGRGCIAWRKEQRNAKTPLYAAPVAQQPQALFIRERQQLEQEWCELRQLQAQYKQPQAEAVPPDVVRDAERWRTFLATRPANTHAVINDAIDAAMAKGEKS